MEAKIYKCFIASPSDITTERQVVDKVFNEINKGIGVRFNFRVESIKWEEDVRPSFDTEGQEVINKQIGLDYQIFIGIMYKNFGMPTSKAGSGTEEEFNNAYERFVKKDNVEIMFYFNDAPSNPSAINPTELEKVNSFKTKVSKLGGLFGTYNGSIEFEENFRKNITKYFLELFKDTSGTSPVQSSDKEKLSKLFNRRLDEALCVFSSKSFTWVEPVLCKSNDISPIPEENYKKRIPLTTIISNPESTIIKSPPQFGLTCLAHYLVKEAWNSHSSLWLYIDSQNIKSFNFVEKSVKNELSILGCKLEDIKCIILDSWTNYENGSIKILKTLSDLYKNVPLIVMHTIDDSKYQEALNQENIERTFSVLQLLALSRNEIRKVVSAYNYKI